jgi:TonB family protein
MKRWNLRKTIIVSILVHSALMLFSVYLPDIFKPMKNEVIEVSYLQPEPPAPAPAPPPKAQVNKLKDLKQIVEQDEKAVNDEKSDEAKFLSAHNQVVKKQTVAANLGEFKNRRENEKTIGDGGKPKLELENLKPKLDFTKLLEKKQIQERELERTLDENAMKFVQEKQKQQKEPIQKQARSEKEGVGGADSSQTNDYLKDVEKGMETMLSTREFVYYSFYSRIRRQLNQHWGGKVRDKMTKIMKEGRSIASSDDKVTKLLITLNRKGQLVKVQVLGDSGIRDLDDAAIEAFQDAAPFPNPPEGIVETDGTIKIRWDFILEA